MAKASQVTTEIIEDMQYQKVKKTYPVKVRITFMRKQRYFPTDIDPTIKDYERMNGPKPRIPFSAVRILFTHRLQAPTLAVSVRQTSNVNDKIRKV